MAGETRTGLIGEHIAIASVLSQPGIIGASLAQQDGIDMVAWDEVGFIRIQVKAATLRFQDKTGRTLKYGFNNGFGRNKTLPTEKKYDLLCHCAIERRRCIFIPTKTLQVVTSRYRPERFDDPDIEARSWQRAMEIFRGE